MAGPVTPSEQSAVVRRYGQTGGDIQDQHKKEAMLKWLRERQVRSNVRPSK